MTELLNPLTTFFRAVVSELLKRLTPEEFADLSEECDTEGEGQTPTLSD